jgi:hypothetical protein
LLFEISLDIDEKEDEQKTSFITSSGIYCYLRMLQGLKNAGGSFSRMTIKVLSTQFGRNMLTYMDDIIVRRTRQEDHILDDVAEVPDLSASRDNSDLAEDDPCDPTTTSKPEAPMQSLNQLLVVTDLADARSA